MKCLNLFFFIIIQIFSIEVKKDHITSLNLKIGNKIKIAEKGFLKKLNIVDSHNSYNSLMKIGKNTNVPSYSISSIRTSVHIRKGSCDAEIKEDVNFIINNGVFSSVTRKISLEGTSDTMYGFKLTSSDVKLKEAKLVKNCYDENRVPEHEYACVIAIFNEVQSFSK
jgi:hypothetical protein